MLERLIFFAPWCKSYVRIFFLIIAPEGCLQYFVNPEGYIKSFNFDMEQSPYPSDLDYSICIRRQQGFCGINLGVYTEGDGKIRWMM